MSTEAERAYEQHIANGTRCYTRGNEKGWCAKGIDLFIAAREAARGSKVQPARQWPCSSCGREMPGPGVCGRCREAQQYELERLYDLSAMRGQGEPDARRRKQSAQM
jgi:hypothetical protein